MTETRIDELTAPPAPGQYYLVPVVRGEWCGRVRWWPVMGSLHEDAKFFRFPDQHYHLDRRFLRSDKDVERAIRSPLHGPAGSKPHPELSAPRWSRRKCRRAEMDFPDWASLSRQVLSMQAALAGAQCQSDATGWICPHRGFRLGSIAVRPDGTIVCPMHGLRIDATGRVLRSEREAESNRERKPREEGTGMTREEHLAWCKGRALEYLDAGDVSNAVTSMMSDLDKHPETKMKPGSILAALGMQAILNQDAAAARRFIVGFN